MKGQMDTVVAVNLSKELIGEEAAWVSELIWVFWKI
jgi:hypothetical protein